MMMIDIVMVMIDVFDANGDDYDDNYNMLIIVIAIYDHKGNSFILNFSF